MNNKIETIGNSEKLDLSDFELLKLIKDKYNINFDTVYKVSETYVTQIVTVKSFAIYNPKLSYYLLNINIDNSITNCFINIDLSVDNTHELDLKFQKYLKFYENFTETQQIKKQFIMDESKLIAVYSITKDRLDKIVIFILDNEELIVHSRYSTILHDEAVTTWFNKQILN